MELEEREAKVCRLCGQFERLYIDVFGEEGMRRYLSVKIHSKINIMIDERDPLPKAICVQCLGKLEFVCDFQEECLRTQHELRDRYNLPPLTELTEIKNEDTPPTRSADNNNSIEKNLNSTSGEDSEQQQQQQRVLRRSLRSQQQSLKSVNDEISIEENSQSSQSIQSTELTPTRWLRRRHNVDSTTSSVTNNNERDEEIPIASRLRSHNNNADNSNQANASSLSVSNSDNESAVEKQHSIQDSAEGSTIQLPTSALNKLLTLVSGAPDIEVSVNESRNRGDVAGGGNGNNNSNSSSNDAEDISFTVELCRKSTEDDPLPELKVRARVFPDQGSCLVDAAIVDLLQNSQGTTGEVNGIVNSILSSTGKNNGITTSKLKDLAKLEEMTEAMQKPEELFRIDGEEIKVDDNVEHVTNDGQNGYACKLCRKFYERRDKCTVHVKTHLGIKQYTCVICNAKFVCKSDVMKHIRCSHTNPRPIQCPKCPKRFKSKFYLTEHDNVHKGVRPYSCTDCGQSYHHKVSLQIHMKSHLPPQNLACEYCGKVFPYRTRLLSHIASVHMKKRRNFRCRFCYNLYSSLSVLNEHVKTRHSTTHICGICGKTFKVVSKFKAHVMQHSNPKPFVCNICNNRYASKAFLNEHLLKHEGLRKHKCKTCNASFAQASHLAAHRHVHGEKTHVCPECGRKFNRRDNMKVHRKRHFEQKKSGTGKQKATASNTTDSVTASTATNEKYAIRDRRSEYDYVQKETHSVFQLRKYLHALPHRPERKIMENDGLPQQVCARCCAKLDFMCDFFEDCRSVQETFSIITSQNTEAAMNQRNDIGIEDESENGNNDEVEIEADKENTVPVVTNSRNLRRVRRYSRQRSIKKHEKNITPLKKQIRNIVTTNGLNKDSNTARPSCKLQVMIVKQEDINGEKTSSQSRKAAKPVETSSRSDDLVRIPIEKSNDSSMCQEKKASSCVNVTSDNQVESKVNDESDLTLAQTTNINLMNDFSLAETDDIAKTAVALPVRSDFLVLEKSHQEAQTNVQDGSSCVSGKDKSRKRSSIKISQLMTEEEKRLVETSYKINLSLMKCEVQNKMTVLNKENIKCNICGVNYSRSDKCRVHIMNHLEIKPYECVKCDYSTVTVSNIRAHIRKCHLKIKPYACDQCDKRYGSMILLQEHINSHTGARPFKCQICDFTYMSRQGLNCHYKTHKLNKDIKCDICPKMFKSTARKNAHMLVHNKENMIQCSICKNYLSSETNLHTHMKKVHSQKYVCNICNKEMLSRKNLYNHKNVHMKAKYKCMLCFKFYKNKHILKEHMLKHEGIRKYKCNDCDKTFAQQSHLAAHSATHSDVRFPCAGCGKQFNRRDNMKMHTKRCQLFLHQSVSTFVPKIRDKLINIQNENNMTR